MDLFLTVSDLRSGANHDVMLTAAPDARVEDVEPLLTQFIDRAAAWYVGGRRLRSEDRLVDAGLCDGATLQVGEPAGGDGRDERPASASKREDVVGHLRVVSGPHAGVAWALRPGTYVIGRSKSTDFNLPSDDQVSRQHARLKVSAEGVFIEDLKSSNGTIVAGVNAAVPTLLSNGERAEVGDSLLSLSMASSPRATVVAGIDGGRVFDRPPRILAKHATARISVPALPVEHQNTAFSIAGIVLPLLIGGAMALLLRKPIFLLFALLSPMMAVSTYITGRRRGSRSRRKAVAEYKERERLYVKEITEAVELETKSFRGTWPDPTDIAEIAGGPLVRLWERRRGDPDFLALRIGLTERPSSVDLVGGPRPDDPNSLGNVPLCTRFRRR